MTKSPHSLSRYVREVRRWLRLQALVRGLALTLLCAVALTLITVPAAHSYRFSESSVHWTRLALMGGTALALALLLALPLLRRWSDRRIARFIEEHHPEFRDRLATAIELSAGRRADAEMLELLLEDTARQVSGVPAESYLDRGRLRRFAAVGAGSLAVLFGLAMFGPALYRYGIGHLWTGWLQASSGPLYQLAVSPGNAKVARRADQAVTARPSGFQPREARLFAYYQSGTRWEEVPMAPEERGSHFRHVFHDVRENIRYYVEAGGVHSPEFQLSVADLPQVKRIELTYHFPAYTGLASRTEPEGGDVRAVKGTEVQVVVHTDIPADTGDLLLDSGKAVELRGSGDRQLRGTLLVEESGLYHVRLARRGDRGQPARASDDYVIDALADQPPVVAIRRPGRDSHPTSIEEVTAQVEAQDDFGLGGLELRFSVNGGPERQVNLLRQRGAKEIQGQHTFFLEDFKLVPGDLVSYYAVGRDARQTAQTDMFFMEVRPFEREYRQSQAMGGMGGESGEGDENSNLVQRQKEIIAATWNLLRDRAESSEDVKALAEIQRRLKQQTETLATRMERRALVGLNREFASLVQNLREAAKAMTPAAEQLAARKLKDALPPEQKALQHLSRAEASFREIQVAFGSSRGGSRGRSGSARELADLFDLELDTQKNQYETLQRAGANRERDRDAKMDAALKRLQELARRQQQLAEERRRQQQQPSASRWEQETLRRQTEELARELDRLARETNSRELDTIRQRLEQAARDMQGQSQSGSRQGQAGSSEAASRERALQRLQEARDLLSRRRGEQGQQMLDRLAQNARQLAREQQQAAELVRRVPAGENQNRAEAFGKAMEQKGRVFDQLNQVERQIHETARQLASTQPEASRKLRGAGNSIREEQLQQKLLQGVDMLRRGLNQLAQQREDSLSQALERLEQQVGEARRSFNARAGEQGGEDRRMERALARAEDLRRRLEELEDRLRRQQQGEARQRGSQQQGQGQQPQGQQAQGQPPQGQQAQGQQQGQGQQRGERAGGAQSAQGGRPEQPGRADGGQQSATRFRGNWGGIPEGAFNFGVDRPYTGTRREAGPLSPEARRELEREYRESLPLAQELQRDLRNDPDFASRVRELVDRMRAMDAGRFPGDPAELERLRASILDGLRQVELELARRLGAAKGELRLPPYEEIPDSYRKEVEQYYRSLAQRRR